MLTWIMKAAAFIWPVVWQFIEPLLRDAVRQQLAILLPLAEDAVRIVENDPIAAATGKQNAAFRLIVNKLAEQESDWADKYAKRNINKAIEMAVEKVFPSGVENA